MLALTYDGQLTLNENYPVPDREPGEALVRVLRAGICRTDLEILQGYLDFKGVLGHEFVGVVERASDQALIGQRVVGEINLSCGHCQTCHALMPNHCPHRTVLGIQDKDGVFAEYVTLPEENLFPIPTDLSDEAAVFVEPLAAACRILEQVRFVEEERVAIIGDGRLGLLIAEVLGRGIRKVTLFGKHEEKLSLVEGLVQTGLVSSYPASAFDVVIDASGSPDGLAAAIHMARPMGTIVLKTTCASGADFNTAPFVIDELTIIGSRCGPFDKALDLLSSSDLDLGKYLTATYPLRDALQAMERAGSKAALKVQIAVE